MANLVGTLHLVLIRQIGPHMWDCEQIFDQKKIMNTCDSNTDIHTSQEVQHLKNLQYHGSTGTFMWVKNIKHQWNIMIFWLRSSFFCWITDDSLSGSKVLSMDKSSITLCPRNYFAYDFDLSIMSRSKHNSRLDYVYWQHFRSDEEVHYKCSSFRCNKGTFTTQTMFSICGLHLIFIYLSETK